MNCNLVFNTTSSSISNTILPNNNIVIYNSGTAYIYMCEQNKVVNITQICKDYNNSSSSIRTTTVNLKIGLFFILNFLFYNI